MSKQEEVAEENTGTDAILFIRLGLMAYLSYVFYGHMGLIGIPIGLFLGFVPIIGGATLIVLAFWGDKIF